LRTVTSALSLTGAFTPSSAVSVTAKVPSSVQVKVVRGDSAFPNEQVVPGSTWRRSRTTSSPEASNFVCHERRTDVGPQSLHTSCRSRQWRTT